MITHEVAWNEAGAWVFDINGKTYKHAYYVEDEIDYLITIYEYSDAFNYVEVSFNSKDLNDPLAQEFLNGLQIPKE